MRTIWNMYLLWQTENVNHFGIRSLSTHNGTDFCRPTILFCDPAAPLSVSTSTLCPFRSTIPVQFRGSASSFVTRHVLNRFNRDCVVAAWFYSFINTGHCCGVTASKWLAIWNKQTNSYFHARLCLIFNEMGNPWRPHRSVVTLRTSIA